MKLKNIFKFAVIAAASATLSGVTSCNYLDVVPPEQPGLSDAMKNHENAKGFLYSCYNKMYQRDFLPRDYRSTINASTDEYLITETWYANEGAPAYAILRNSQTTTAPGGYNPDFWNTFYAGIGQTLLFDQQLMTIGQENDVNQGNDEERREWLAESRFCRAFYHFQLLRLYGPIPLTTELLDMDSDIDEYPGRTHFDGCVDWICAELDAAAADLPSTREPQDLGRATSVICKALKARVLLYAASDLWNGKFPSPYSGWCKSGNTNYTSTNPVTGEDYGHSLVYTGTPRESRWREALIACKEALKRAKDANYKLYDPFYDNDQQALDDKVFPNNIWVPDFDNMTNKMIEAANKGVLLANTNNPNGFDENTKVEPEEFDPVQFQRAVWKLRYLNTTTYLEGNTEIIWAQNTQAYGLNDARLPRHAKLVKKDSGDQWKEGWNGVAPTLYTIEHFLNADGTLPGGNISKAFDPMDNSNFYTQPSPALGEDNEIDRSSVTRICINREPRFYAWIGFDGGDYLQGLDNGKPVVLDMKDPNKQGRQLTERNYSATGFLSMKHVDPYSRWNDTGDWISGKNSPEVFIRLAELYLNLAECQAEYAKRFGNAIPEGYTLDEGCPSLADEAIANINKLRNRAYVAPLTPNDTLMVETLADGSSKPWDLVEWVRNERFIELWDEGQRYFDVRRWVAGPEYFGYGKRRSLNALVEKPGSVKNFNTPMMANPQYTFHYREYLYPIYVDQVYRNPQMVQNPGF